MTDNRRAWRLTTLLPSRADYRDLRRTWRGDLVAGLTVGVVALPLALGFGASSGLSPEAGLVTAIVAGVLAAVFGGSNVQVSGPTGAMVVVLVPIVAQHGAGAVVVVTLLAGVLVLAAGALRLGRAVAIIPWPVIEGFTLGIAVIIFLQQGPALASAHPAPASERSANAAVAAVQALAHADPVYLAWALGAVAVVAAIMLALPRIHRLMPASLVAIAVVAVAALAVDAPLSRIGKLPSSLPLPALPAIDPATLPSLVMPALTVAALAAIESLLSARVATQLGDTGRYDPDRELVGLGLASIGSALFCGMPATGAIARTAVNVRSGGRTRLAAIVHALVLLLVVLVAAGPVGQIPLAALGGVLMVTAVRMVHRATVRAILRSSRADATLFVVTALVTVSVDLIVAVGIGLLAAGIVALRGLARQAGIVIEPVPDARPGDEAIAIVRFDGSLIFASAERVADDVARIEGASVVILRISNVQSMDATGARALAELVTGLEARGVTVLLKGARPAHRALRAEVGTLGALRHENHLFDDLPAALAHARSHIARSASNHSPIDHAA